MMNDPQFEITLTAKADEMYDKNRPGFVHAHREPHPRPGWVRLAFPSGLICTTNSSPIESELAYNEVFETKDYLSSQIRIHDNDTILDIGANIGMFSMYLLRNYTKPIIHAVEPVPDTFEVLQENTSQFPREQVHLHNIAIGSGAHSSVQIVAFPHMTGNSTSYPQTKEAQRRILATVFTEKELAYVYTEKRITVPCTTLSTLIEVNHIHAVDLLKIDTEGAEMDILKGVKARHWPMIRQVAMEVHNEAVTLPTITAILTSHGLHPSVHETTRDPFGTVVISAKRQ